MKRVGFREFAGMSRVKISMLQVVMFEKGRKCQFWQNGVVVIRKKEAYLIKRTSKLIKTIIVQGEKSL